MVSTIFSPCFKLKLVFSEKYVIPSGAFIVFLPLVVHTNPKYWGEDALEFKPERFNTDHFKQMHSYSYFPFSKGPRACPGSKYANKSMKIFLSRFLMKYKVSSSLKYEELKFQLKLTSHVEQGFMMRVEKRENTI